MSVLISDIGTSLQEMLPGPGSSHKAGRFVVARGWVEGEWGVTANIGLLIGVTKVF